MEDETKVVRDCEDVRVQENKDEEYQDPYEDLPPIFNDPKDDDRKLRLKNLKSRTPPLLTDTDNSDTDSDQPPPLLTDTDHTNTDYDSENDQITKINVTKLTENELRQFTNEDNDKVTWTFTETNETPSTELELQQQHSKPNFPIKFLYEVTPNHCPTDNLEEEDEGIHYVDDIGVINKLKVND